MVNRKDKIMKQPNYTASMTAQIIDDYQANKSVEEIATSIGKSVRSVRSKLVREGVYVAQEKRLQESLTSQLKKCC